MALEYKISSALRTTTGRISCHSLFFLVLELWIWCITLTEQTTRQIKNNPTEIQTKMMSKNREETWKSLEWVILWWVGAYHCAKLFAHTHKASGLVLASSRQGEFSSAQLSYGVLSEKNPLKTTKCLEFQDSRKKKGLVLFFNSVVCWCVERLNYLTEGIT